mgnify:CR=1 FL=1
MPLLELLTSFNFIEMVSVTANNDAELQTMEDKILKLNGEIDSYIQKLRNQQAYYRSCTL